MPFETPQNQGFLVAAYVVAALIYLGYSVSLWRRSRKALGGGSAGRRRRVSLGKTTARGGPCREGTPTGVGGDGCERGAGPERSTEPTPPFGTGGRSH
jgi:hypothetical protein